STNNARPCATQPTASAAASRRELSRRGPAANPYATNDTNAHHDARETPHKIIRPSVLSRPAHRAPPTGAPPPLIHGFCTHRPTVALGQVAARPDTHHRRQRAGHAARDPHGAARGRRRSACGA